MLLLLLSFLVFDIASADHCPTYWVHNPQNPAECITTYIWDSGGTPTTVTTDPNSYSTTHSDPVAPTTVLPNPNPVTPIAPPEDNSDYELLAPLGEFKFFNSKEDCAFGRYLEIMINIFLGICAVLAMVMIIMGGIEYMTSELVSSKENGKNQITQAIFGLLLALGAWLILNQINPNLLKLCLDKLPRATPVYVERFKITGPLTPFSNSKTIKVNFNKNAYPAALIASKKTGVDVALILAIFSQETGSGANTGQCNYLTAHMKEGQLGALQDVASKLGMDYTKINMSCRAGASTHGGAIGYTQFLPGTWQQYAGQATGLLGHYPNPWNVDDALMMTALYLKSVGGATNPKEAACKYFAGPGNSCSTNEGINSYGDSVMARMANLRNQIAMGILDGTLSP